MQRWARIMQMECAQKKYAHRTGPQPGQQNRSGEAAETRGLVTCLGMPQPSAALNGAAAETEEGRGKVDADAIPCPRQASRSYRQALVPPHKGANRCLKKNIAQHHTLFVVAYVIIARKALSASARARRRPQTRPRRTQAGAGPEISRSTILPTRYCLHYDALAQMSAQFPDILSVIA